jgi:2'-5' RNA ligase
VRAFFGLPVPEAQRQELERFLESCALVAPQFRWSAPANLHLTVRFIGSVERAVVEGIADRLDKSSAPAFEVALGDLGTFRRGRMVRVIWLGLRSDADSPAALAQRVEAACQEAGLEPERRPFNPHLTLARAKVREGEPLPDLPQLPSLAPWHATELVLYWSHLARGGAVHEPIRTIALSGAS